MLQRLQPLHVRGDLRAQRVIFRLRGDAELRRPQQPPVPSVLGICAPLQQRPQFARPRCGLRGIGDLIQMTEAIRVRRAEPTICPHVCQELSLICEIPAGIDFSEGRAHLGIEGIEPLRAVHTNDKDLPATLGFDDCHATVSAGLCG